VLFSDYYIQSCWVECSYPQCLLRGQLYLLEDHHLLQVDHQHLHVAHHLHYQTILHHLQPRDGNKKLLDGMLILISFSSLWFYVTLDLIYRLYKTELIHCTEKKYVVIMFINSYIFIVLSRFMKLGV
jgi:hypothetical protein